MEDKGSLPLGAAAEKAGVVGESQLAESQQRSQDFRG